MKREKKTPEKCKTCPYALGFINTLVDPCPKCMGKTSIFGKGVPMPGGAQSENMWDA